MMRLKSDYLCFDIYRRRYFVTKGILNHSATVLKQSRRNVFTMTQDAELSKPLGFESSYSVNEKKVLIDESVKSAFHLESLPNLLAYVDVCVQSKATRLAHKVILHYHRKTSLSCQPLAVDVCNIVLHGWAKQANYTRLGHLLRLMEREGPAATLQSYAAAIECVVRAGCEKHEVWRILMKIKQKGFDIDDLFIKCKFVRDQEAKVVKGIRMISPTFSPKREVPNLDYSCYLLQELNSGTSPKSPFCSLLGEDLDIQKLKELSKMQVEAETQGCVKINSIVKETPEPEKYLQWEKVLKEYKCQWKKILRDTFEKNLAELEITLAANVDFRITRLYPFLTVLPADLYIDYMLKEIEIIASTFKRTRPKLSDLQNELGTKIMERYFLETKRRNGILDKITFLYNEFCQYYINPELMSKHTPRQYWEMLRQVHCSGTEVDFADRTWSGDVVSAVGQFLYKIILTSIRIDENILDPNNKVEKLGWAIFSVLCPDRNILRFDSFAPSPVLVELCKLANCEDLTLSTKSVPLISPPRPWSSLYGGGFSVSSAAFICGSSVQHSMMSAESAKRENLYPTFDALNVLGECAWKINQRVLDVMIEIFNEMGTVEADMLQRSERCLSSQDEGNDWKRMTTMRNFSNNKRARMSLSTLKKLSIANKFRNNVMWLPHNIDFRGRFFPFPKHLNHAEPREGDAGSALLVFAKGEKLGEEGLKWLKIHLINLAGLMKRRSLEDRLKCFEENLPFVFDSADNPFEGKKWWLYSDKPWQTLACCIELAAALRSASPHDYISHLPVHQDGPSNILQHFAALGRDLEGAEQVNLIPSECPQDAYTKILELTESECAKDACAGSDIAKYAVGVLDRNAVKKLVMIKVYGLTHGNAEGMVLDCLQGMPHIPLELSGELPTYLARRTFRAIEQLFSSSMHIKEWLHNCSALISRACSQPVMWETPLGLPISQPYYRSEETVLELENGKQVLIQEQIPRATKQSNSFTPNYIHSLEASHLTLTSLFCQRAGVPFASFHDSFWTLPSQVDTMNKICREQFVALYSEPLLSDLSECMLKVQQQGKPEGCNDKTITRILSAVPKTGSFDLRQVRNSKYFFS